MSESVVFRNWSPEAPEGDDNWESHLMYHGCPQNVFLTAPFSSVMLYDLFSSVFGPYAYRPNSTYRSLPLGLSKALDCAFFCFSYC